MTETEKVEEKVENLSLEDKNEKAEEKPAEIPENASTEDGKKKEEEEEQEEDQEA